MSDAEAGQGGASSGPRWALIAVGILALAGLIVVAVLLFSDDDSESPSDSTGVETSESTTLPPDTTMPATTVPETTVPATTVPATSAPETTAPATTSAPGTTGAPTTTAPATTAAPETEVRFSVTDIPDGGAVPVEFTCDGDNEAPIVDVDAVPTGTAQLALIVDDPDAPTATPFVHWVVYGIPGDTDRITDGVQDFTYGVNDTGTSGWFGPCPPPGDGPHRYVFTLYALGEALALDPDLDGRALFSAIEGSIVGEADITASYERAAS